MKRSLLASVLILSLLGGALAAERSMLARVTVYWASGGSGSDAWTRKHVAASGARLRSGHCAVDPRRIPYGSKVTLPDGTLVAVDTGGSVRNRRAARRCGRSSAERNAIVIDRFFEAKGQALAWAKNNPQFMTVRVSAPNESSTAIATSTTTTTTTTTLRTRAASKALASTSVGTKKTAIVAKAVAQSRPPQPIHVATNVTTTAAVRTPPAPPPLRNSISTPRTTPALVVTTSGKAPTITVVPTSSPSPASSRRITAVLKSAPKIAANTSPAATSAAADDTRSHYGRAVAYVR